MRVRRIFLKLVLKVKRNFQLQILILIYCCSRPHWSPVDVAPTCSVPEPATLMTITVTGDFHVVRSVGDDKFLGLKLYEN